MVNKSLPWDYDFKFVVEEISNVNDKAQVSSLYYIVEDFEPYFMISALHLPCYYLAFTSLIIRYHLAHCKS